ncbi:hypothetical protein AVEN_76269-1 [Araneus ventricosus]|uniref:Uncharacterized protein n=1 Tax=Araneus ventricosus TaxID=182803 RepID=A0A4Y2IAC2_ARAVE|nr:hypothetical protein AVEN_76269-1 [Araneus ventricosus]
MAELLFMVKVDKSASLSLANILFSYLTKKLRWLSTLSKDEDMTGVQLFHTKEEIQGTVEAYLKTLVVTFQKGGIGKSVHRPKVNSLNPDRVRIPVPQTIIPYLPFFTEIPGGRHPSFGDQLSAKKGTTFLTLNPLRRPKPPESGLCRMGRFETA